MNRQCFLTNPTRMAIFVLVTLSAAGYSAEIRREGDFLGTLRQEDPTSREESYAVSFTMARQASLDDPNQGMVLMDCRAAHIDPATLAMKITYHYEKNPVFVRLGSKGYQRGDYYKGQLVVWRSEEKYTCASPERNIAIERLRRLLIDPNNRVTSENASTMYYYWPIGADDGAPEFRQFHLSVGRGYCKHITHTVSTKQSGALLTATADGSYGAQGPEGNWELSVDPNSYYLVRGAFYCLKGQDRPSLVTRNSGLLSKGNIRMARYGTYQSPFLKLSTEATNIETEPSEVRRFFDEVRATLDAAPPVGASIVDLRSGRPVRTRVGQTSKEIPAGRGESESAHVTEPQPR